MFANRFRVRLRSVTARVSRLFSCITIAFTIAWAAPCSLTAAEIDDALRNVLSQQGISPLPTLAPIDDAKIELGQLLFFDKELSGNRDTACASCHHPQLTSGDARSLPIGTAGRGLGPTKELGEGREIVPRNSPEIFHRGQSEWTTMFWDSRVSVENGEFKTPAGSRLPAGLDNVLAAQAMFPVTSRSEMRGGIGDSDVNGVANELCDVPDDDLPAMWQALTNRLLAIPEYQERFAEVYPDIPRDALGFQQAANAIAAFEATAFAQSDSAWDRYLHGDNGAMSEAAKRGAHVFFGEGNCASCHSGNLLTDQQHHNIGVPQLGPGKNPATSLDEGRELITGDAADAFAFRTPPLRNVTVTGPWMHNGAYTDLEDAVRHYKDPELALRNYDATQLVEALQGTVRFDEATISAIVNTLDADVSSGVHLSNDQIQDLMAFVFSLTSPTIDELPNLVPDSVPSGLDVDRLVGSSLALTYDPATGELAVDPTDQATAIAGLFMRLREGTDGAGFGFRLGEAVWSEEITLSDDERAQSFIEYRSGKPFLLRAGDSVGNLLPAGLSQEDLDHFLAAVYMRDDSSALWAASVVAVSEPHAIVLVLVAGGTLLGRWRRSPRRVVFSVS